MRQIVQNNLNNPQFNVHQVIFLTLNDIFKNKITKFVIFLYFLVTRAKLLLKVFTLTEVGEVKTHKA